MEIWIGVEVGDPVQRWTKNKQTSRRVRLRHCSALKSENVILTTHKCKKIRRRPQKAYCDICIGKPGCQLAQARLWQTRKTNSCSCSHPRLYDRTR